MTGSRVYLRKLFQSVEIFACMCIPMSILWVACPLLIGAYTAGYAIMVPAITDRRLARPCTHFRRKPVSYISPQL